MHTKIDRILKMQEQILAMNEPKALIQAGSKRALCQYPACIDDWIAYLAELKILGLYHSLNAPHWQNLFFYVQCSMPRHSSQTVRQRLGDWRRFILWCAQYNLQPLPAESSTVRLYLLSHVRFGDPKRQLRDTPMVIASIASELEKAGISRCKNLVRVRTLERYINTISCFHSWVTLGSDPTLEWPARMAMRMARRHFSWKDEPQTAIRQEEVEEVFLLPHQRLLDIQDALLVLLSREVGVRTGVVAKTTVEAVKRLSDGSAMVRFPADSRMKYNEPIDKKISATTFQLILTWARIADISRGYLFLSMPGRNSKLIRRKWDTPPSSSSATASVRRCMQRIGHAEVNQYGGKSVRIGAVQELVENGGNLDDAMIYGSWRTEYMPLRYTHLIKHCALPAMPTHPGYPKDRNTYFPVQPAIQPFCGKCLIDYMLDQRVLSVTEVDAYKYWENIEIWFNGKDDNYVEHTNLRRIQDWHRFVNWCGKHKRSPLPASVDTIQHYFLAHMRYVDLHVLTSEQKELISRNESMLDNHGIERAKKPLRHSTLVRYLNSISTLHFIAQAPNPTRSPEMENFLEIVRPICVTDVKQWSAIRHTHIADIISLHCVSLREHQDRLITAFAYDVGQKTGTIAGVFVEDVENKSDLTTRVRFHTPNGVNEQSFYKVLSPAVSRLLSEWLLLSGITQGPLFRPLAGRRNSKHAPPAKAISTNAITSAIKRCVARINCPELESIGGNSTRIGGVRDLAERGCSLDQIMCYGNWRSGAVPKRHTRK